MKRMKKFFATMLALLAMLAFAQTALAANVPVYLEGERVATALERGGYTYLPLRTMFETVGAAVEWDGASQTITATFADGGVLTMQVGEQYARSEYDYKMGDNEYGNPDSPFMEQPAFLSRGTCYVPLRFITDSVLGYDVDWRNNTVYIKQPRLEYQQGDDVYVMNMAAGQLSLNGQVVAENIAVPGYAGYHAQHVYDFTVRRTPQGSYLLAGSGTSRGFMIRDLQWNCWVSADGSKNYSDCQTALVGYNLSGVVYGAGKVWLNGYSHNFCIDEASGEVNQLDTDAWAQQVLDDEYAVGDIYWSDGRLILLGSHRDFVLYDMTSQTGRNIIPLLLNDEFKAQANAILTEKSILTFNSEEYWNRLDSIEFSESPRLKFSGAEGDKLNFELTCRYYAHEDGSTENEVFTLSCNANEILPE